MQSRIAAVFLAMLSALAVIAVAPGRVSASPQQTQPVCKCCPRVYVTEADPCDCTVQLANEVRQIGRCKLGNCPFGGNCGTPTQICRLWATANEVGTGCTGSKEIDMQAECGASNFDFLTCTAGGTNDHSIELRCDPCTCPSAWDCTW